MTKSKIMMATALLSFALLAPSLYAQESAPLSMRMSLADCLEYAKENSITLQKAQLTLSSSQADQLSAKGAFMPTISGSVSQGVSSYPLSDEDSTSAYVGSYGVDLSLTLYNGGRNRAQLSQSQINEKIATLAIGEAENTLESAITEIYVEILYTIEQIKVAQSSLEVSEKNQERGSSLLAAGSINKVDQAQLESATASSRYDVVVAQAQLSDLYVALKHLLEISQDVSFEVGEVELSQSTLFAPIPTVAEVYAVALDSRPEIQSSRLSIESAQLDATIAKSGYLPTLSLTAGTGINHSSSSSYAFSAQMRNNFITSAGLSLSIPILSNYINKSAVTIANNNVKSASLSLTEAEKELYKAIETLRNSAASAQSLYSASEYMLEAALKSVELTEEQYRVGLISTIDLLAERDNYNQTHQQHLINKYQLVLSKALLNFYKTDIIKL